jgi:MinD-like ATPase involved in chromosome partitioning or flagellar assembly
LVLDSDPEKKNRLAFARLRIKPKALAVVNNIIYNKYIRKGAIMNSVEKLTEQLEAFKAVQHKLKHKNEGLDIKTVDHYYKWVTDVIEIIEFQIEKEDQFQNIKEKVIQKEGDLVFPFVERTK